jgi:hypothetical protein
MEKKEGKDNKLPIKEDNFKKMNKKELEELLLENFITLQKVLTNLSLKFDELSNNISRLLELFEISAKSFKDKYESVDLSQSSNLDKDFLKKLDSLLDQNKTISKAIMLMEERIRNKNAIKETESSNYNMLSPKKLQPNY